MVKFCYVCYRIVVPNGIKLYAKSTGKAHNQSNLPNTSSFNTIQLHYLNICAFCPLLYGSAIEEQVCGHCSLCRFLDRKLQKQMEDIKLVYF